MNRFRIPKFYKKNKLSFLILIIISVCILVLSLAHNYKKHKQIPQRMITIIPKKLKFERIIYQTTKTKQDIPEKVYQQFQKFAPGYKHVIFDDEECIEFLGKHYDQRHIDRFHNLLMGAFKADLFRYCLLYINGGIYMDIKTEIIRPFDEIFMDRTKMYCVMQFDKQGIYQGILASPPRNPIFLELIDYVLTTNPSHYHEYTRDFYRRIRNFPSEDIILFEERCNYDEQECHGLDRYGLCCNVFWNGNKIIKTRFNDYPW